MKQEDKEPHNNGSSRRLWMRLLKEGCRLSARELSEMEDQDRPSVYGNLRRMAKFGECVQFAKGASEEAQRVKFGVTTDCIVPKGITVRELMRAINGE